MTQTAQITGTVEYRAGDGPMQTIPKGPVEIVATALDATISWQDGGLSNSAAVPIDEFQRYVAQGDIRLDG
ncbi:hypothetical protein [Pseudorhodoferax sp.]|uniref:hypothetical protein n=1 Tax=Pseudorhodoferax sp. TaxID=1993553 RepID=UPI0039E40B33